MRPVDPECLKCHTKSFDNIEDFDEHVLICYGKQSLTVDFICNQNSCAKKKWNSAEVLHYHLFIEHQVSNRVCDICGQVVKCPWNTITPLTSHKSRHYSNDTKKENKKFKCEECNKFFSCKSRLKSHTDVQHPLKCHICSKWCKDDLTRRQHHWDHLKLKPSN